MSNRTDRYGPTQEREDDATGAWRDEEGPYLVLPGEETDGEGDAYVALRKPALTLPVMTDGWGARRRG